MPKNFMHIWNTLLLLLGATTLWFSWGAGQDLIEYYKLSHQTDADILDWKPLKLSDEDFTIEANYSYTLNKTPHFGKYRFDHRHFPNLWGADSTIRYLSSKKWKAWYNPNDIKQTSLEKFFPFKRCFYSFILAGLLIYFFLLGKYISKQMGP